MSGTETKAERKERKRLKKLAKEAKRAEKKRELEAPTYSVEKDSHLISGYLRENASGLVASEHLSHHLCQICFTFLHISTPYRFFTDDGRRPQFKLSNDATTAKCVSAQSLEHLSTVFVEPYVVRSHQKLCIRVDAAKAEDPILLNVATTNRSFSVSVHSFWTSIKVVGSFFQNTLVSYLHFFEIR